MMGVEYSSVVRGHIRTRLSILITTPHLKHSLSFDRIIIFWVQYRICSVLRIQYTTSMTPGQCSAKEQK